MSEGERERAGPSLPGRAKAARPWPQERKLGVVVAYAKKGAASRSWVRGGRVATGSKFEAGALQWWFLGFEPA